MIRTTHQFRRRARGLTFVELIIGTAVMGLVMMALASFTTAIAAGWKHSQHTRGIRDVGSRVGEQLQSSITNMRAVIYSKAGSRDTQSDAYIFYWAGDTYGGVADGKAQFGEMGLLEYRAGNKAIYLYEPKAQADMTTAERTTAATENWGTAASQSDADAVVTYFKNSGIPVAARRLAGQDSEGNGTMVSAVSMNVLAPVNAKPMVNYELVLTDPVALAAKDENARQRAYGTAILRGARKPTNIP